jgi:hypothetical protein
MKLSAIQDAVNVCDLLDDEKIREIGDEVVKTYEIDLTSRRKRETKMDEAMDLALQLVEAKSYPWPNAANVKFPLLTIAALQFASRAYPALVKVPDLVKFNKQGKDPDGSKAGRAMRIGAHMSYQLLEQDESWEEDHDKGLLVLPIVGSFFKKSYYDPVASKRQNAKPRSFSFTSGRFGNENYGVSSRNTITDQCPLLLIVKRTFDKDCRPLLMTTIRPEPFWSSIVTLIWTAIITKSRTSLRWTRKPRRLPALSLGLIALSPSSPLRLRNCKNA